MFIYCSYCGCMDRQEYTHCVHNVAVHTDAHIDANA